MKKIIYYVLHRKVKYANGPVLWEEIYESKDFNEIDKKYNYYKKYSNNEYHILKITEEIIK